MKRLMICFPFNIRKMLSLMLVLSLVFTMAACSAQSGPEDAVKKYCEAMKEFDTSEMFSCTNESLTKKGIFADELSYYFQSKFKAYPGFVPFFKRSATQILYKITDVNVSEKMATVVVNFSYVDAEGLISETLQTFLAQTRRISFDDVDKNEMDRRFQLLFNQKESLITPGTTEAIVTFRCVNKGDDWIIEETPKEIKTILSCNVENAFEPINEAYVKAVNLFGAGEYSAAGEAFTELGFYKDSPGRAAESVATEEFLKQYIDTHDGAIDNYNNDAVIEMVSGRVSMNYERFVDVSPTECRNTEIDIDLEGDEEIGIRFSENTLDRETRKGSSGGIQYAKESLSWDSERKLHIYSPLAYESVYEVAITPEIVVVTLLSGDDKHSYCGVYSVDLEASNRKHSHTWICKKNSKEIHCYFCDEVITPDSIKAKNGKGLIDVERAFIYMWLDYYLTAQNSNGKYIYSESQAFSIVQDMFGISKYYIDNYIWNGHAWSDYNKYY